MTSACSIGELRSALAQARSTSLRLVEGLDDLQVRMQPHREFSPLAWHMGHVAWQEEIWVHRAVAGREPIDRRLDGIFDSFVSEKASRGSRLPPLGEILRYAREVRERTLEILESFEERPEDRLLRNGWVFRFLANHERQHGETMAVVRLLAGLILPGLPPAESASPVASGFGEIVGGWFHLGCDDDPDGWDNERCAHEVELGPFRIGRHPVTSADWLRFIDEGGYRRERLWSREGWRWRSGSGVVAPLHWALGADGWSRETLAGPRPVDPSHPVSHVSWFEAEAFARFAGARLPTEAEWERAACWDAAAGRKRRWPWGEDPDAGGTNLGLERGDTSPCSEAPGRSSASGAFGLAGDVWEWTASEFRPYPGFAADPYRGYSEPWFGDGHRVLRGGSHLSHRAMARATFRNWFHPGMRVFPTGLRLALDA